MGGVAACFIRPALAEAAAACRLLGRATRRRWCNMSIYIYIHIYL